MTTNFYNFPFPSPKKKQWDEFINMNEIEKDIPVLLS